MSQTISQSESSLTAWLNGSGLKEQITRTVYDLSYFNGDDVLKPEVLTQRNLRNRVSYTQVFDIQPVSYIGTHRAATFYTYDIHGNVDTLLQDYNVGVMKDAGNQYKRIAYNYDLVSGKVNKVIYQPDFYSNVTQSWITPKDQFFHRYEYNAENKITNAWTSHDGWIWEKDARYTYYKHGPLARTILGNAQVQGLDYAYTLQGWIKGVNSSSVGDGTYDMGGDGKTGSPNAAITRDAYGYSLNYYTAVVNSVTVNDYKPIGLATSSFVSNTYSLTNTGSTVVAKPLFNGNIASMLVNLPKLGQAQLYGYGYDQLNRIVSMDAFTGLTNSTNVFVPAASDNYKERVTYDANGNILTYLRNGETASSGQLMDNLRYQYERDASGNKLSNKLRYVLDLVQGNSYTGDLKTQSTLNETQFNNDKSVSLTGDNYRYDKIGNLTKDFTEGITNISWSVYGKILSVAKSTGTITYTYDGSGNRISKTYNGVTTWYVRDASGNVMAMYEKRADLNSNHLTQTEIHLYGSSRLGILTTNRDVETAGSPGNGIFERGNKFFELSNHLGNVLATVSDRRVQVSAGGINVDYYQADVVSASDYYPFGMSMPGRKYESQSRYRYGFNGKENDLETKTQDYGFRIYNTALGRFLSVDPLTGQYPWYTPYQFAGNKPIWAIDIDGLEPAETSTEQNPKDLEEVTISSSSKKSTAIDYVNQRASNLWQYGYKWGTDISNDNFINQLKDRIQFPYKLNQGDGTNFCWAACAMSYQFQRNPVGMSSTLLDLYSKGKSKVGNIELQVSDQVRYAIGSNTFDKNEGLTGHLVDQLIMMTLAGNLGDYVNFFQRGYNPGDQNGLWASGTFNKFDRVMRMFGSNVVTSHGYDAMKDNVLGDACQKLMDAQAAGQSIFLFVYSAHFKHPKGDTRADIGTHFIQVRNIKKEGSVISMDYWDYGKWKTGTNRASLSLDQLDACTFGILTTKD